MKIISFDPKTIENKAKFFNEKIAEITDEKYVMFVFDDIYAGMKNEDEVKAAYENLMKEFDLPYAFFSYYIHFNRIFQDSIRKPSPRIKINFHNKIALDVVQEPAYGLLVIDLEKIKAIDFKFNERYGKVFYLQDLIITCFNKNLYISNSYFCDVGDSYELFNADFKEGYAVDPKIFNDEKQLFYNENRVEFEQINAFLDNFKKKYVGETAPVIENGENV
jgi:hypothetical protein